MPLRISAIIITCNRRELLRRAITALAAQSLPPDQYELIVVDNGSTDGTREMVESEFGGVSNLRYLVETEKGSSQARNAGWHEANAEIIAFTDDDAVVASDWLEKILAAFESVRPMPGAIGGRVELIWPCAKPDWITPQMEMVLAALDHSPDPIFLVEGQSLWGCNVSYERKTLEACGGFNTALSRREGSLLSNDEQDFHQKLIKHGLRLYYDPSIRVQHQVHEDRLNRAWFVRRAYWQGISNAISDLVQEGITRRKLKQRGIVNFLNVFCRPPIRSLMSSKLRDQAWLYWRRRLANRWGYCRAAFGNPLK